MSRFTKCLVAVALCAATVRAWDDSNGWKQDDERPQITQTHMSVCVTNGQSGCDVAQDKESTRTWEGYWDYITIGGG